MSESERMESAWCYECIFVNTSTYKLTALKILARVHLNSAIRVAAAAAGPPAAAAAATAAEFACEERVKFGGFFFFYFGCILWVALLSTCVRLSSSSSTSTSFFVFKWFGKIIFLDVAVVFTGHALL